MICLFAVNAVKWNFTKVRCYATAELMVLAEHLLVSRVLDQFLVVDGVPVKRYGPQETPSSIDAEIAAALGPA
jgi:glutathione peroxidase-family protein